MNNNENIKFINNFDKTYNQYSVDDFKNIVNESNVNYQNEYGYTILMMTIFYKQFYLTDYLLQIDNVNLELHTNKHHYTPLLYISTHDYFNLNIAQKIFSKTKDINKKSLYGFSALDISFFDYCNYAFKMNKRNIDDYKIWNKILISKKLPVNETTISLMNKQGYNNIDDFLTK